MRADWFISPHTQRCGGCDVPIAAGAPRRRLRTGRIRCASCAKRMLDEDVPGDLAPMPSPPAPRTTQPFVSRPPHQRWLPDTDFKTRQGNADGD
jgi:hypothetical protein